VALVGYETLDIRYRPGDSVAVTVFWQVIARSDRDYSLSLALLDSDNRAIGKVDSYPGAGRLRTSTWQPGALYADLYVIPLSADATGRYVLRMQVAWWHYPTKTYISPAAEDGQPLKSVILNVGAFVDSQAQPLVGDLVQIEPVDFGGAIRLLAYRRFGDDLLLLWESSRELADDYTVFVHVLDSEGNTVGQGDAPPTLPTHYWRPGERFLTHHTLTYRQPLSAGTYRIVVGWYSAADFARLSADFPEDASPVATITIP
jgi:hypothetical protein